MFLLNPAYASAQFKPYKVLKSWKEAAFLSLSREKMKEVSTKYWSAEHVLG